MNITLSVDDRVVEQARKAAQSMGKSLNQAVRDYLEQLAGHGRHEAVIEELRELSMRSKAPGKGWRFDRNDAYDQRPMLRRGT